MQDFFERYADKLMPIPFSGCLWWEGSATPKGYGTLNRDGKTTLVHRDAYEAVHGPSSADGKVIRHWCDCPPCCAEGHLIAGTHQENTDDMIAKGRQRYARGEDHPRAKLTSIQVAEIRSRRAAGETGTSLAKEYGVGRTAIYDITNNQKWKV